MLLTVSAAASGVWMLPLSDSTAPAWNRSKPLKPTPVQSHSSQVQLQKRSSRFTKLAATFFFSCTKKGKFLLLY